MKFVLAIAAFALGVLTAAYVNSNLDVENLSAVCIEDINNGTIKAEAVKATKLIRLSDGATMMVYDTLEDLNNNPDFIKIACPKEE